MSNCPPGCLCAACQMEALRNVYGQSAPLQPNHPPAPNSPAPGRNSSLPAPWEDAINAACNLGMVRSKVLHTAIPLAMTHPRATPEQALRLLLGSG